MTRPCCPVCGDPGVYLFWIDQEPPEGCPYTPEARSVTECSYQMRKAAQRALMRKVAPHCFDSQGNMLPGRLAEVLAALPRDVVLVV